MKIFNNNKRRFAAESVRGCLFWRHCLYTVRHSELYCIHVSTCKSDESIAVLESVRQFFMHCCFEICDKELYCATLNSKVQLLIQLSRRILHILV